MTACERSKERLLPAAYRLNAYEVFMTWDCNLRCAYCYECLAGKDTATRREEREGAITSAKITEVVDFIAETHDKNAKELRIIFWGGEPFLAFEQIQEMIAKIEQAQADGRIEKEVSYTTTSNLTVITLEQMRYLQTKHFSILVSLDGLEKTTDQNRGKGTFAKVIRNMALLHGLRIPFSIRATITLAEDSNLVDDLRFLNALRYDFWWSIDHTRGRLTADNLPVVLQQLLAFYSTAPRNYDKTLDKYLATAPKKTWCIDPYETISIDPDGGLHICSRVDKLIGTVRDGVTAYPEIKEWSFYSGQPRPGCADCVVYDNCKGGCLGTHLDVNDSQNAADYELNTGWCQEMFLLQLLNEELILRHQYQELKEQNKQEVLV
jgi:uncharacterized protein